MTVSSARFASAGAVAVVASILLLASGVTAAELVRFVCYEAVFVGLPGILLFRLLDGGHGSPVRVIVVGWPLGYVMEVLTFLTLSSAGLRSGFWVYPLVVCGLLGAIDAVTRRSRRSSVPASDQLADPWTWTMGLVCCAALVYVALGFYEGLPLPQTVSSVTYYRDIVWAVGNAVEARDHWPMTNPHVVGAESLYQTFVYLHLGAVSYVTGIGMPVVVFRLFLVPMVLVLLVQSAWLATLLAPELKGVGAAAACLVVLVGELDPFPWIDAPFLNVFFLHLTMSPTFLLCLIVFLALAVVLGEGTRHPSAVVSTRHWALIVFLVVGCGGAKATAIPVLLAASGLHFVWAWAADGKRDPVPVQLAGVCVAAWAAFWALEFSSYASAPWLRSLQPLVIIQNMELIKIAGRKWPVLRSPAIGFSLRLLATPVGLAGFFGAKALGLWRVWRDDGWRCPNRLQRWLFCLFLAGLLPFLFVSARGNAQLYFFWFGYVAASVLAAAGLCRWWIFARDRSRPWRVRVLGRAVLAIALAIAALDTPIDHAWQVYRLLTGRPPYSQIDAQLTGGLFEGLSWIRTHTPSTSVLAANAFYGRSQPEGGMYPYYAAFAERRVFLEAWFYTFAAARVGAAALSEEGHPFPERLSLSRGAFEAGDPDSVREMRRRYGVTHLFIDKVHGSALPEMEPAVRRVFANDDCEVYEVADDSHRPQGS